MTHVIDKYFVEHGVSANDLRSVRWRPLAYAGLGVMGLLAIVLMGGIAINVAAAMGTGA